MKQTGLDIYTTLMAQWTLLLAGGKLFPFDSLIAQGRNELQDPSVLHSGILRPPWITPHTLVCEVIQIGRQDGDESPVLS